LSDVAPTQWQPCPKTYETIRFKVDGTLTVKDQHDLYACARPGIVKDVAMRVLTNPTGANLITEIQKFDNVAGTWVDMFSTLPTITAGSSNTSGDPDGTYAYRCLGGGTASGAGDELIRLNITQVGSGVAGAELWCWVRLMRYQRALESLYEHDHFGA